MLVADLHFGAGQGDVDGLCLQFHFLLSGLQKFVALLEVSGDELPDLVGHLADFRALFGGQLAHRLEDGGQFTLLAEVLDTDGVEFLQRCSALDGGCGFRADLFELFSRIHAICFLSKVRLFFRYGSFVRGEIRAIKRTPPHHGTKS